MFAEVSSRPERPPFSRTNSRQSRLSLMESPTKKKSSVAGPSVSFAEPDREGNIQHERPHWPHLSRRTSTPVVQQASFVGESNGQQSGDKDAHIGIEGLLAEYRARRRSGSNDNGSGSGSGSSYSTQDLALSFNDLPNRAQYLILNELMRKHSGDSGNGSGEAAVLFTTLPIPDEGTHRDRDASVQYLLDVELLCQDLPPVLMILSNNMTVTVSL